MPIARYFIFVGGTLAALLFIAGWCLPTPPAMFADQQLAIDKAIIRIRVCAQMAGKGCPGYQQADHNASGRRGTLQRRIRSGYRLTKRETQSNLEAMAQLKPDTQPVAVDHPTLQIKRGVARTARSKRVARGYIAHRLARAEAGGGCCQFGWIDNGQASSNAMPRRRAASSWPME